MKHPAPPVPPPLAPALPHWVRPATGAEQPERALFAVGAALACLDPRARDEDAVGQLWRRRLALTAAEAMSAMDGRREDAAALRDHWVLRAADDDPGPAARQLRAWRQLGEPRALQGADWPERLPALFDLPADPALQAALRRHAARPAARGLPLASATEAAADLLRLGAQNRALALWLADALLAQGLGWDRPVPLLATQISRTDLRHATADDGRWLAACAQALTRAAVAAADLHDDLTRRATRLRQMAPKLRSRDAPAFVARLLTEDALAAQAGATTSDRAARRLFDRLTSLGLVRELTRRPSFRLYGL